MKKWYSLLETMKVPLLMLFMGTVMMSANSFTFENTTIALISTASAYFGYAFIRLTPIAFIICFVSEKKQGALPIISSIAAYILLEIITMYGCKANLPAYFYDNLLGLNTSYGAAIAGTTRQPLNMGLIGSAIIIIISNIAYKSSEKRQNYGILSFISNDAWCFIITFLLTIASGIAICFCYPIIADFTTTILQRVSRNSGNPAIMFIYGIIDKLLSLSGLHEIIEQGFWVGELGGSWIDGNKVTYLGDINIWTAQYNQSAIVNGTGRFVSAYYVINLFIIPAIIIGMFLNVKNKVERKRYLAIAIIAIVSTICTGSSLVIDYALLFIAPTLLVLEVIGSATVFMVLSIMEAYLGHILTSDVSLSMVGNINEFLMYINSVNFHETAMKIVTVGSICFVVYLIIVFFYYNALARDFMEPKELDEEAHIIIQALGGYDNINMIVSSLSNFAVVLKDKGKLNGSILLKSGAYKVKERYFGYIIEYGPGAKKICRKIRKNIDTYREIQTKYAGVKHD